MTAPIVIDRYELAEELATGGMATVYLGRVRGAEGFSRVVAVKRLHRQYARDASFVAMFLDEARLASRIRHPNVVPTLDVVQSEGELFLVMDYIHGESLSAIRKRAEQTGERIPIAIACAIASDVLQGLHAAHEATDETGRSLELVHRDVSPQNVLVGADGISRVLDFGVSKAEGRLQSTSEGQVKGKIAYMSPEQLNGFTDRRCDVYAASVVLWELLAGRRLFTGEGQAQLVTRVLAGNVPPIRDLAPDVPELLDEVLACGLDRTPSRRFATTREMDRALKKAVSVATAFDVAEWVGKLMHAELAERRAIVVRVEGAPEAKLDRSAPHRLAELAARGPTSSTRTPDEAGVTQVTASTTNEPTPSRSRLLPIVAFAVAATALAVGASVVALRREPMPATSPSASFGDMESAAPSASAPPTVASSAIASATASSPRPTPSASSRPHAGRQGCNPPFTVDAEGHKHFIVECL